MQVLAKEKEGISSVWVSCNPVEISRITPICCALVPFTRKAVDGDFYEIIRRLHSSICFSSKSVSRAIHGRLPSKTQVSHNQRAV
jgi:hypothetical protein